MRDFENFLCFSSAMARCERAGSAEVQEFSTLTRTDVLHVHQSTISANKDVSAKNINLVPGSYGRKVRGRKVRGRRVVGSG